MFLHPGEKGGAEIETDPGVIVDQVDHPLFRIEDAGRGIACITFRMDLLIPVVIRVGGVLKFHPFQPGVLPRGLIKVAMNTDVSFH
jgi:hypothetical protein